MRTLLWLSPCLLASCAVTPSAEQQTMYSVHSSAAPVETVAQPEVAPVAESPAPADFALVETVEQPLVVPVATPLPPAQDAAEFNKFSYTYVQLSAIVADIDGISDDPDGWALTGSWGVTEHFHVFGGYSDLTGDVDVSQYALGVGFNTPVNERMDAVVRGALLGDDLSGGDDDTGWGLAALVRFWALKTLELDGGISYRDVIVSDTSLDVAALWYFVPNFALVGDASFGNDATYYGLGVRFTL